MCRVRASCFSTETHLGGSPQNLHPQGFVALNSKFNRSAQWRYTSSFLKGTGLCIFGINVSKHPKASSSTQYLVKNFMTVVHIGQEHLEIASTHLVDKGIIESKPQLVLRRPGLFVKEVQVLELKVGHHSELPLAGLHAKPKLQRNLKKNGGGRNHLQIKLPKKILLPRIHVNAQPMAANMMCSDQVQKVIGFIQKAWASTGSIDEVMEKHNAQLSSRDISSMLLELQRCHDWQCTLVLFHWIKKQPWHRPNSRLYTRLIGFLGREGQVDQASLLFQEMLLEKCNVDQYTFTAMLNAYGKAHMFKEAISVFNHMKQSHEPEKKPNTVTCNALINSLVKGGLYDLALKTFLDMQNATNGLNQACKPNVITYNVLINALCKEGLVEVGVRVLHTMRSGGDNQVLPNVATYNTVIDACAKLGFYEKVEELMEEMVEHGIEPDRITYTALIDAYGKSGQWEYAENTFKGMKGAHIEPDVMAYTAMIDAYAKEGLYEKAESLFKTMDQCGLRANEITYLSLIDAYGKGGLPEEAWSVFLAMEAAGYKGNVLIHSALIDAYGRAGCYEQAVEIFNNMRIYGCQPNLITYNAILSSCSKCDSWADAVVLLQCLQGSENGIEWTLRRLVSDNLLDEKLWESVSQMLEELKAQPKVMQYSFCNTVIDVLWSLGLRGRAAQVLSLARENQVYNHEFCIYSTTEWCLDLHRLSVGAACTMLLMWLEELHLALLWGEDSPEFVVIVTGKGKHSKSKSSMLKAPIDAQLVHLNFPFLEQGRNSGRVVASGSSVRDWLFSSGIKQQLSLVDATNPQPFYETLSK
ncbi:unnamed protein product [Sphagnum jensenii]|uniref:Smr domain-containing protein n=1 Tax=Sphagnum jensenii TaxID=128206 RepID=A0ABP0WMB2_9BRYO